MASNLRTGGLADVRETIRRTSLQLYGWTASYFEYCLREVSRVATDLNHVLAGLNISYGETGSDVGGALEGSRLSCEDGACRAAASDEVTTSLTAHTDRALSVRGYEG